MMASVRCRFLVERNLVPRVFRLPTRESGKTKDPGNEVVLNGSNMVPVAVKLLSSRVTNFFNPSE